ncbi:MAG: DNA repair protein RadA [Oscillospiraceae bacterium]|jgi:DNA repair protein RadA/Sms|nr:DNA repair protein RadA [Oscillospiraceae bacterium]
MKAKTAFFCTDCGNEFSKWNGQCPACGAWNTLTEQPKEVARPTAARAGTPTRVPAAYPLGALSLVGEARFSTGLGELDRVLGGGAVAGSLVLVGGEPGVGKSTLLLQICDCLSRSFKVLYVSGEESASQIKLRADRLGVCDNGRLFVLAETELDALLGAVDALAPDILIVDSIQTMHTGDLSAAPGNVGQVKTCTLAFMELAKGRGITVFVIGHLNKEGAIAGPRVLEHMVDCVLYFEGERSLTYRVLRAAKNRFGSTNEIGLFEMGREGLEEVPNPSEFLLAGRPLGVSGSCVACVLEGTRPVLAEVQALVTPTSFGVPRRMVSGIDYNRAMLLLAVLEKRAGLFTGNCDAYINVVGGLSCGEPAADLPTLLACASSTRDKPVHGRLCAIGEVGLAGELRAVSGLTQRLAEVARLGFSTCLIPRQGTQKLQAPEGLEVIRARHIQEALQAAL